FEEILLINRDNVSYSTGYPKSLTITVPIRHSSDSDQHTDGNIYTIRPQPEEPHACSYTKLMAWIQHMDLYSHDDQHSQDGPLFPAVSIEGEINTTTPFMISSISILFNRCVTNANSNPGRRGSAPVYGSHCLRRGGALHRFLYSRKKWSLPVIQRWGGWSAKGKDEEGESMDAVIRYLLECDRSKSSQSTQDYSDALGTTLATSTDEKDSALERMMLSMDTRHTSTLAQHTMTLAGHTSALKTLESLPHRFTKNGRVIRKEMGIMNQEIGCLRVSLGTMNREMGALTEVLQSMKKEMGALNGLLRPMKYENHFLRQDVRDLKQIVQILVETITDSGISSAVSIQDTTNNTDKPEAGGSHTSIKQATKHGIHSERPDSSTTAQKRKRNCRDSTFINYMVDISTDGDDDDDDNDDNSTDKDDDGRGSQDNNNDNNLPESDDDGRDGNIDNNLDGNEHIEEYTHFDEFIQRTLEETVDMDVDDRQQQQQQEQQQQQQQQQGDSSLAETVEPVFPTPSVDQAGEPILGRSKQFVVLPRARNWMDAIKQWYAGVPIKNIPPLRTWTRDLVGDSASTWRRRRIIALEYERLGRKSFEMAQQTVSQPSNYLGKSLDISSSNYGV
ncbi:hypothetical protein BG004_003110, partial [Podila humilis]